MEEVKKMYPAVCGECGAECKVPFEPKKDKPVKCLACFKKSRPARNFGGSERTMYDAKCSVCGKACQVPFKPTEGKAISCRDCFMKTKKSK